MNILFYYDPVTHKANSTWRKAHLALDIPLFRNLSSEATGGRIDSRVMIGNRYLHTARLHGLEAKDIILLNPEELTAAVGATHEDINRIAYDGTLSDEGSKRIAKVLKNALGSFIPDIVITWTPAPFFSHVNSDILILHKETGILQRNPFPATFFLDVLGCYSQSLLCRKLQSVETIPILANSHLQEFERLRNTICGRITKVSPFTRQTAELRERFRFLVLVPLQYNGSFSFDGLCNFRSQFELAEHVLRNSPSTVGFIFTSHPYGYLTSDEQLHLSREFSNAIFIEETAHYQNSSDMLIPCVDGVVTVSSTTGLKALLWQKKLITIGKPYLGFLDDATSLENLEATLAAEYNTEKDKALAWICLYYSFPLESCKEPGWAEALFTRIHSFHRSGNIENCFDEFHGDLTASVDSLIAASTRLHFPVLNERAILESRIANLKPGQVKCLLRSLELSTTHATSGLINRDDFRKSLETIYPTIEFAGCPLTPKSEIKKNARIVFLYASGRSGASGPYLKDLSSHLVEIGHECMIVAEGDLPKNGLEDGVKWRQFKFDGPLLAPSLKREIMGFSPDVLIMVNVRFRPMRAALELYAATGAKLVVQSEDDDTAIYLKYHPSPNPKMLELLDKPKISNRDIGEFMKLLNWDFTIQAYKGTRPFRDVEPLLRVLCYRMSSLNTAIWHPMQERLIAAFDKPGLIVPPVIEMDDYSDRPITKEQRARILSKRKIDPNHFVIFLGGTIYGFSPEFETFLRSLNIVSKFIDVTLVVTGKSAASVNIDNLKSTILSPKVPLISLGSPPDDEYLAMMAAADVIAAPGFPDTFNRYRLSSRLVKAMALAKPIFTYECGFGESLDHCKNAILTKTENPEEWAYKLMLLTDPLTRRSIGIAARKFAEQHFDARMTATRLSKVLNKIIKVPDEKSLPPHIRVGRFLESLAKVIPSVPAPSTDDTQKTIN